MTTNFIKIEEDILALWQEGNFFEKLRTKNKGNPPFRFIDGPITANNPMGIHHAWGRSIKDIFLRYKAMNGYSSHYRNGFDAQGLWVEVEVEKELGFKDKRDIETYGMDNFTKKCVQRVMHYSEIITQQSKRLGQWMDWENSYFTHTDENISAIWHFLKLCHQNDWIAKSYKPMPWCPRCGTSLSEHEMSGSHKEITHTAVFAIAKLGAEFDALVWTTTPWTLSANAALAVNPALDYAIVKCENFNKPLVMAKNAIKHVQGEKQVLRLIKGEELVGLKYETFFPRLPAQQEIKHCVIPWADVGANEGSGIVHIAPGCGAEDFELGKGFSLAEICPIDDSGVFLEGYDLLTGKTASQAAELVFENLRQQGKLFKTHEYTHSYPVCWRCKTEVLFRLVREWYIKTDDIRPSLIAAANTVHWEPAFIGKRMLDWLNNMGDWNISRKRFYGLPLPFYPCEACGHLTVVGGKDELVALGGEAASSLPELHRPWVDDVVINCPLCNQKVTRIPDVGDVWLDAGIVPFSTLGYFTNREEWEQNFPAEWVIEMQEQVRLWFYSQLFMSVVITGKAPYQRVQTNNWVLAEDGSKFSKTGFMIRFDEVAGKVGADASRYLFAGASMASDVRFGFQLGEEARRKLLGFWNIYTFFMTYGDIDTPVISVNAPTDLSDIWLNNRVNAFVAGAAKGYESYSTPEVVREFEQCVDDVSNWYVRINRRRFWKEAADRDKLSAYSSLYYAIKKIAQVMAPILPFMAEHMWQTMILKYEPQGEESVHLSDFPAVCEYNPQVLADVEKVREVIAQALKLRNEQGLKVKQPLATLYLEKSFEELSAYEAVIRDELNIKDIAYLEDFNVLCDEYVSLNFQVAGRKLKGDLGKVKGLCDNLAYDAKLVAEVKRGGAVQIEGYDGELSADCFTLLTKDKAGIARSAGSPLVAINTQITPELKAEGLYRELLRHCQLLRKEAGYVVTDKVLLAFVTDSQEISTIIDAYAQDIEREALAVIGEVTMPIMQKRVELDVGAVDVLIGKTLCDR